MGKCKQRNRAQISTDNCILVQRAAVTTPGALHAASGIAWQELQCGYKGSEQKHELRSRPLQLGTSLWYRKTNSKEKLPGKKHLRANTDSHSFKWREVEGSTRQFSRGDTVLYCDNLQNVYWHILQPHFCRAAAIAVAGSTT